MNKKSYETTREMEGQTCCWRPDLQDEDLYPKKDTTVPTLDHSALLTFLSSMMKRKGVRFHAMDLIVLVSII